MKNMVYVELGGIDIADNNCTNLINELQAYQGDKEPYSVKLVLETDLYGDLYFSVVHHREETDDEYNIRMIHENNKAKENTARSTIDELMAKDKLTNEEKKELIDLIMEIK